MPATMIVSNYTGRLGNRLLLQAHLVAAAAEFGSRVINLALLPSSRLLAGFHCNPLGEFPPRHFLPGLPILCRPLRGWVAKWVCSRLASGHTHGRHWRIFDTSRTWTDMTSADFRHELESHRKLFLWGWLFRAYPLIKKHARCIRSQLSIRPEAAPNLKPFFSSLREKNERLVCVHVRQGDARNVPASEGLYIPAEDLARAYRANLNHFGKHRLVVCSDEPVPPGLFPGQALATPLRPLEEDLVLMSKSQWILGGRSTLSRFAAFVGGASYLDCSGVSSKEPRLLPSLETLDDVG